MRAVTSGYRKAMLLLYVKHFEGGFEGSRNYPHHERLCRQVNHSSKLAMPPVSGNLREAVRLTLGVDR
jgi:hypothetical protein